MWQVKQVEPSQDVRTHRDAGIKNRTGGEDTKDSTDGFTEGYVMPEQGDIHTPFFSGKRLIFLRD
jgi:hypothetical protein